MLRVHSHFDLVTPGSLMCRVFSEADVVGFYMVTLADLKLRKMPNHNPVTLVGGIISVLAMSAVFLGGDNRVSKRECWS